MVPARPWHIANDGSGPHNNYIPAKYYTSYTSYNTRYYLGNSESEKILELDVTKPGSIFLTKNIEVITYPICNDSAKWTYSCLGVTSTSMQ